MNDENVTSTSLDTPYFHLCLEFGETSWFVEMCGRYDNLEMWKWRSLWFAVRLMTSVSCHQSRYPAWCSGTSKLLTLSRFSWWMHEECEHHTPKVLNIHHQLPLFSFRFQLLARKCAPHQYFQYLAPGPKIRWKKRFWNPFKGQKQNITLHFRRVLDTHHGSVCFNFRKVRRFEHDKTMKTQRKNGKINLEFFCFLRSKSSCQLKPRWNGYRLFKGRSSLNSGPTGGGDTSHQHKPLSIRGI